MDVVLKIDKIKKYNFYFLSCNPTVAFFSFYILLVAGLSHSDFNFTINQIK